MAIQPSELSGHALRFTLRPVGRARDEKTMMAQVEEAREEALKAFAQEHADHGGLEVTTESAGGFFGAGAEWVWFFHVAHAAAPYLQKAAEGLATGAGVETAKLLFKCFADSLRKRDFVVTEPGVASKANEARNREAKKAPSQKKKPKTKKKKAQGKRKKSRR